MHLLHRCSMHDLPTLHNSPPSACTSSSSSSTLSKSCGTTVETLLALSLPSSSASAAEGAADDMTPTDVGCSYSTPDEVKVVAAGSGGDNVDVPTTSVAHPPSTLPPSKLRPEQRQAQWAIPLPNLQQRPMQQQQQADC
ncbi:hypothetical protein CVT25_007694 [Psilocybe cyanescens]|uniref:Uncharacterized protein n=1 Tax=Psilocybe cyanescens TaxID=93625 RepID=A0A409X141_PSICY|nr:hypothetical protein CVT25_007694 [Psilocybe cyanescens]